MSDSVRPHSWQPTRLRSPWDFPSKNTGVGCHFLLQCRKVKSEREVAQSSPTLRDPMHCSLSGSSIHWIFQARVLEWGAIAFSRSWHSLTTISLISWAGISPCPQPSQFFYLKMDWWFLLPSSFVAICTEIVDSKKNIYFCFIDYAKAFDCVDHNKLWKILKEMGITDHLTCLLRNLYAGQEATVRTTDWFQIGEGVHQGCILSPCLFNLYAEYIMKNTGLEETQAGIKNQ